MLVCCNQFFYGHFAKIIADNSFYFRRIEFGICPHCGVSKFIDYIQDCQGNETIKEFSGEKAINRFHKWEKMFLSPNLGSKGNQNVYYGDFQKTKRKDENGIPIYYQLRKNFNNQSEIIGEIKTHIYNIYC